MSMLKIILLAFPTSTLSALLLGQITLLSSYVFVGTHDYISQIILIVTTKTALCSFCSCIAGMRTNPEK